MTQIPHILGGRYEVRELIGRGGMAEVHMGYDVRLSRTVAIKILRAELAQDPMFLARFRREAQSAAALNHPSIVAVYDTGEEQIPSDTDENRTLSLPYIIMEYIHGRTVASLLADGDPVPIGEAVQITVGVLNALEYSHREGIIHRDIKPGNVMLTPDDKVKVMDFGIARAIADSAATMTQTNSVVGTAQYLSPEQARGEVVDSRSDLYSTGCLFYELLTGKPPFTGDSAVSVAYQHVSEPPKPASSVAPDVPDSLDRVVMKALAKQRDQRYQSAGEFRADLLAAARGEGVQAPSVTSWNMPPVTPAFPPTMVQTSPGYSPSQTMPGVTSSFVSQNQTEKPKGPKKWIIALLVALAVIALAGGAWAVMHMSNAGKEEPTAAPTVEQVKVPSLEGLNEQGVKNALEAAGLKFARGADEASDDVEKGFFVSSNPAPGTPVEKGLKVTVVFSSGPSSVTMPNIVGLSTEDAKKQLEDLGLKLGTVEEKDDPSQKKGLITTQSQEANTQLDAGTVITVTVASGKVPVPDLKGLTLRDAQDRLNSSALQINADITYQETATTPEGTVLSQAPAAGSVVDQGTYISLTVSKKPISVPEPSTSADPTTSPSEGGGSEKPKN